MAEDMHPAQPPVTPHGRYSVSAAAAAGDTGDPGRNRPMRWSLGVLGDALWMRVPAARPFLAELLAECVEEALESDRELLPLSPMAIAREVLWRKLLMPALAAHPLDIGLLAKLLQMVILVHLDPAAELDSSRESLSRILEDLSDEENLNIIRSIDPEIARTISRLCQ